MQAQARVKLNPRKLLLSKWTAVNPQNLEKHFIVTKLIDPERADAPVELIELEAVHSQRSFTIPWNWLTDQEQWRQGWK